VYPILEEVLNQAVLDFKKISPVDTWEYQGSIASLWISEFPDKLVWTIISNDKKAENVEYGWRKSPVNWHLASGQIKNAKGASVFQIWTITAGENLRIKLKQLLW
jgi:hypothetical protein